MNKCRACDRDFTSVTAFDQHRTGSHSARSRRCMTAQDVTTGISWPPKKPYVGRDDKISRSNGWANALAKTA